MRLMLMDLIPMRLMLMGLVLILMSGCRRSSARNAASDAGDLINDTHQCVSTFSPVKLMAAVVDAIPAHASRKHRRTAQSLGT